MKAYYSDIHGYYHGDSPIDNTTIEVPPRPNHYYDWVGDDWVLNTTRLKLDKLKEIDDKSEEVRNKYITPGFGQSMTYLKKAEDAHLFASNGYPEDSTSGYVYITAEATARGMTKTDAANYIIATEQAWQTLAATIEEIRIRGKYQLEALTSESEILNHVNLIIGELNVL